VVSLAALSGNLREDAGRENGEAPVGVEPTVADLQSDSKPRKTSGKAGIPEGMGADVGAVEPKTQHFAPDLQAIIDAWPALPEAIKAGILGMVRAAGGAVDLPPSSKDTWLVAYPIRGRISGRSAPLGVSPNSDRPRRRLPTDFREAWT
jgi:hypothetical protein